VARIDASALHAALRAQVDGRWLPGVSTALLRGREVLDRFCCGWADIDAGTPLREDHIVRVFSNSKLVTSCAVLLLVEEGRIALDEPIETWLPELGHRHVLGPGAKRIDDTVPAKSSITVRHLMTHTSGLSYGLFDPGTVLFEAYREARVIDPARPLAAMVSALAPLPLSFQPGSRWQYSVATDVLGHLVEVASGMTFGAFLARRIFEPLGMVDTGFHVPEPKRDRLCALYGSADPGDPNLPGFRRLRDQPFAGDFAAGLALESGGIGLVSTLGDWVLLLQSLMPGGPTLLRAESLAQMGRNQLPRGMCVEFTGVARDEGRCFGLGSAVTVSAGPNEPAESVGEVGWGGLSGTAWWIHPRLGLAGVLMTQRYLGFGHLAAFRREAYRALGKG
jgi:CubicO group peptidase (beta-lactamase class C family)